MSVFILWPVPEDDDSPERQIVQPLRLPSPVSATFEFLPSSSLRICSLVQLVVLKACKGLQTGQQVAGQVDTMVAHPFIEPARREL